MQVDVLGVSKQWVGIAVRICKVLGGHMDWASGLVPLRSAIMTDTSDIVNQVLQRWLCLIYL